MVIKSKFSVQHTKQTRVQVPKCPNFKNCLYVVGNSNMQEIKLDVRDTTGYSAISFLIATM